MTMRKTEELKRTRRDSTHYSITSSDQPAPIPFLASIFLDVELSNNFFHTEFCSLISYTVNFVFQNSGVPLVPYRFDIASLYCCKELCIYCC
uniref:Uncharacterized protein n=1 Tax=Kalanchoe fedtschenkoi TaxID=63787 RepID=A0A7N0TTU2_KALFE